MNRSKENLIVNTLQRVALLASTSATLFLVACGGAGDVPSSDSSASTPTPAPRNVVFAAVATSASTASLGWERPAGGATVAIERKSASGDWATVASVDARSGSYLDSGLSAVTDYSYRLVEVGATRHTLAERSTKTGNEQPVISAPGTALGDTVIKTMGSAGGQVASPDGAIVVNLPAGAFAADVGAAAQPVNNTAPDGRGNGLKVSLDTTPAAPLTLTLRYDAAQDVEADAQRVAVQRTDGSWISLPPVALDKTARTLTAELPPSLFAAPPAAHAAAAGKTARATAAGARAEGANLSIEFTVVRYLAFHLEPKQALVKVKKSLELTPYARVRGYEIMVESCEQDHGNELCLPLPVMETREIALLNSKAGFDRRWTVSGVEGGNTTVGTVAPSGSTGAAYKAPDRVPDPSTVTVSFRSHNVATGRTVTLSSPIEISDDRWVGTMSAENGPSDAGTTFIAIAHATWEIDDAASTDTRKVYRATGDVDVVVADDDCSVSVSPSRQPVATNAQLVELVVDESRSPMTYTAHLITFWPATLSAVCPKASASQQTLAGYGWDVSGAVSDDGRRIEGKSTVDGASLEWSFTR